ncbi:hypothetical protein MTO96_038991 [Rhipicephalus appendiculatus]
MSIRFSLVVLRAVFSPSASTDSLLRTYVRALAAQLIRQYALLRARGGVVASPGRRRCLAKRPDLLDFNLARSRRRRIRVHVSSFLYGSPFRELRVVDRRLEGAVLLFC